MQLKTIRASAPCVVGSLLVAQMLVGCSSNDSSKSSSTTAPATSSQSVSGATLRVSLLSEARGDHTATSTPQGVVVVGGEMNGKLLSSIEVYQNGQWTPSATLNVGRKGHSATLLGNGKVLIAGGQSDTQGSSILDDTWLYDPVNNTVTAGPALSQPRSGHAAALFRHNQGEFVLIAGGVSGGASVASGEIYDVAKNVTYSLPRPMVQDRVGAQAISLPNGMVLIQGGLTGFQSAAPVLQAGGAELFDPSSASFVATGPMAINRFGASMGLTDSGQVVVLGGNSVARVESSGEALSSKWTSLKGSLQQAREDLSVTALRSGELLAVGGSDQQPSAAVDMLVTLPDPVNGEFRALNPLKSARASHTATLLANGNVLIVGGFGQGGALNSAEEYDAFCDAASAPNPPPVTQPAKALNPATPITPVTPTTPTTTPPAPPEILLLLPSKGKPGDLITIAGRNFAKDRKDNQVLFHGGAAGLVLFEVKIKRLPVIGPVETLIVEVPQNAQTGPVTVFSNGLPSSAKSFTIDMSTAGTPKVLYTLPRKAEVGDVVTIFGWNFAKPASDNVVKFSGVPAQLIGGITTQSIPFLGNVAVMLVRVPTGAVTGDLTIEAYGKTSPGYSFEVEGTVAAASSSSTSSTSTSPSTGSTSAGSTTTTQPASSGTVVYAEDFESASINMTAQGSVWEVAKPTAGPSAAASGQYCAGTGMSQGKYAAAASGYLFTQEIDLSSAASAELSFSQFFDTDGVDAGRVIVSPDGGQNFYLLRPTGGYMSTSIFNPGEGFCGQSGGWLNTSFDLSAYAGQRIVIAFDFYADTIDERAGWFIDDVVVRAN